MPATSAVGARFGGALRRAPPFARACARLVALLGALSILASPKAAAAQSTSSAQPTQAARDEAASRFKKGIERFNDGDYQAALIEFRRAYDLIPNYSVLYNIGQVQYQLQDYAGALSSLERYLADGGRQIPASRRSEVAKDIQRLKSRVSQIEISINVPDAEIAIDDIAVGKGPFTQPITVSSGRRKITASKEGYTPQSKLLDLASNDTATITFELEKRGSAQPAPAAEAPKQAPAPEHGSGSKTPPQGSPPRATNSGAARADERKSPVPWVGWAATGAFATGAVVFGVISLGKSSDLQDLRTQLGVSSDALSSEADQTTLFAVMSDVCTGAALIAGGVSLYLTIYGSSSGGEATRGQVDPAIRVGVTPSGVRVLGSF